MFDFQKEVASNPRFSSDNTTNIYDSYDSLNSSNSSMKFRRKFQMNEDHGEPSGGIEFGAQTYLKDESEGISSPPLWKSSPPTSPRRDISQLRRHYRYLSPAARSQAIARGQMELMEMAQNMPESSYELSLKDIVERPIEGRELRKEIATNRGGKERKKNGKGKMVRSKSMDNGAFLLKMFFPISFGYNKSKGSPTKVSPKPQYLEGSEKDVDKDKEWRRKGLSVAGENENGETRSGSIGSRESRHKGGGCLPAFKSFFQRKESKTKHRKATCYKKEIL